MAKPISWLKRMPPWKTEVVAACAVPKQRASAKLSPAPTSSASQITPAMAPSGSRPRSTAAIAETSRDGSSTQKTSRSTPAQIASSRSSQRRSSAPASSMAKGGRKTSRKRAKPGGASGPGAAPGGDGPGRGGGAGDLAQAGSLGARLRAIGPRRGMGDVQPAMRLAVEDDVECAAAGGVEPDLGRALGTAKLRFAEPAAQLGRAGA